MIKKKVKQIKCRNCGKIVSSHAKRCKYCGTVLKMPITGIIIVCALFLLIIAIIIIGVLQSG
ncbi:MAG: zinc-ribbon domain-containing protein [Candidatus Cloacimonetes bacterium]|nr:zinc-ribbon domain-containing protein [Candidatus Cloacimonadota bacterium]